MFTCIFSHTCPSAHSGFDVEAGGVMGEVGDRTSVLRQMAA